MVAPANGLTIENTTGFMLGGPSQITPQPTAKFGYERTQVAAPSNANLTDLQTCYRARERLDVGRGGAVQVLTRIEGA